MRHLLDTHTILWYALGDPQLRSTARALIIDPNNEILIGPASFWEIAIKLSVRKLTLNRPYQDFMDACLNQHAFTILPILPTHTARVIALPFHHKDPFDRLLIAQAQVEGISMISADLVFDSYGITRLW